MAITLTENAVERVRKVLEQQPGEGLRLGVKEAGCSGLTYVVEVADGERDGDAVFEDKGVRIYVDAGSLPYVDGTEVDYRRDGLNVAFAFNNPHAAGSSGCGEGFTV